MLITAEVLETLEEKIGIRPILTELEFQSILKLPKVILYILVDWSGYERISRNTVYKILKDIGLRNVPVFKIDCSNQKQEFFLNWLGKQSKDLSDVFFAGSGETLLIEKERAVDLIKNPGGLGVAKTMEVIHGWVTNG